MDLLLQLADVKAKSLAYVFNNVKIRKIISIQRRKETIRETVKKLKEKLKRWRAFTRTTLDPAEGKAPEPDPAQGKQPVEWPASEGGLRTSPGPGQPADRGDTGNADKAAGRQQKAVQFTEEVHAKEDEVVADRQNTSEVEFKKKQQQVPAHEASRFH